MTINFDKYHDDVLFVPLGGSNEIGMNLNLYHYKGKWLMVDLGMGFADDYLPGIEVIVPDIEFLYDIKEDIVGVVLTHAHEDHLGAVPYLWEELDIKCPIYATRFTANILKNKLAGEGIKSSAKINQVEPASNIKIDVFNLEMIPLTHSIPEMQAIAIKTDKGTIIHTGDWKIDPKPLVGELSDEKTLAKYGDEGVMAMVCDSTNIFVEGESGSESTVRENLLNVIKECKERVFVATFASNVARVESILYAAKEVGRKVALVGRSIQRTIDAAHESGYLQEYTEFISDKDVGAYKKEEVLVLCTGCQGEPRAALTRMAAGSHPTLRMTGGDTVLFSARDIPGNETRLRWLYNKLASQDVKIVTSHDEHIHVSGHPARAELRRMYELVRPNIAVPVHGEAQHIREHCDFARNEMSVPQVVKSFNGAVIKLSKDDASVVDTVESGYIAIDGTSMISINSPVISMRRRLRDEGCIAVSVVLEKGGKMLSHPHITAPGSLDADADESLIAELQDSITSIIQSAGRRVKISALKDKIRSVIRKTIKSELGKRPVIEVHIHHV